jgi:hypothetical protein
VATLAIPLWPMHATEAYLRERVHWHQEAERRLEQGDALPACTPEERWA